MSQMVDSVTTTYVLDTATPLTMVLSETTGETTIRYWHGLDLIAQSDGTAITYLGYDGLGSVRQLTDTAGAVQLAQTFDPYGSQNISLEQYLNDPSKYNRDGSDLVDPARIRLDKYNIISVLSPRSVSLRDSTTTTGSGGGTMIQKFSWEELVIPGWMCSDHQYLPISGPLYPAKPG